MTWWSRLRDTGIYLNKKVQKMQLHFVIDGSVHRGFTRLKMVFAKMDLGLILLFCVASVANVAK